MVDFCDGLLGVEHSREIERDSYMDVCEGGRITADVLKNNFGFKKSKFSRS